MACCFFPVGPDLLLNADFFVGNIIHYGINGDAIIVSADGTHLCTCVDQ